ncbi:MAG: diacylglycerol kinase family lipid kinase [Rhodospirillaceae bacterium]|nr:diacylglycerol kinase family lipid kinase [Rhodospirillaceae bacterium]
MPQDRDAPASVQPCESAALSGRADISPPRRILVVFNPIAGRKRRPKLDAVLAALSPIADVAVVETTHRGHAEEIARAADPARVDLIAAAGGDGTVNEVVNGLRGKSIALGVIPLGTANVLADEIALSRRPARVAATLARGALRPIHVGLANGRRFVMMAGAGFDANVVAGVSLALKKKLGPLAYVIETARLAFTDAFAGLDLVIDGAPHRTVSAVVCNGRHYGGPFVAAPGAALTDDLLHVVLLKGRGWTSVARYGLALVLGRLPTLADVDIVAGRRIAIRGTSAAPLQADGDIVTALPAEIAVDPEPVRLAYPA